MADRSMNNSFFFFLKEAGVCNIHLFKYLSADSVSGIVLGMGLQLRNKTELVLIKFYKKHKYLPKPFPTVAAVRVTEKEGGKRVSITAQVSLDLPPSSSRIRL